MNTHDSDPELVSSSPCVHRWKLGAPIGDVTHGQCAVCGATRDFTHAARTMYPARGVARAKTPE